MDWILFIPGALGALFTMYFTKEEIPEFRSIFNTSTDIAELDALKKKQEDTRKDRDETQERLKKSGDSPPANNLYEHVKSCEKELAEYGERIKILESRIRADQKWRKGAGFAIYVILGGFFGVVLTYLAKIEGSSTEPNKYIASLLIGSGWTGWISAIGLKGVPKKAEESVQNLENKTNQTLSQFKDQFEKMLSDARKPAPPVGAVAVGPKPEELKSLLIGVASEIENNFKTTKEQLQRDVRGFI